MTCGERVKEIRKTLGLTLEKFGEPLGVTKVAISNIEKGNRNVTEQMLKAICREYSVNEDWLKNGIGEMFRKPSDEVGYYVEDLLEYEGQGNPFYDIIIEMMKTYQELDDSSKSVIKKYFSNVRKSIDEKKEAD